jgi:hypothetical protein
MDTNSKTLFDNNIRNYNGVANHNESTYSFLNRSARPASLKVRSCIEEWYTHYPDKYKYELNKRIKTNFSATFFELLINEILIRNYSSVHIHPTISAKKTKHPDFLVEDTSKKSFFLEATTVTDQTEKDQAQHKILQTMYDQINKINIPDYYLVINTIHNPSGKQPSGTKFKEFVLDSINHLNYDYLSTLNELGAIHKLPKWIYKEKDFEVKFGIIPVSKNNRNNPNHRTIGIYPINTRWGGSDISIQSKIIKKANKYGQLDRSFIIAINYIGNWGLQKSDVLNALYGTESPRFIISSGALALSEKTKGAWYNKNGPVNKRISAVILTNVFPWNLPIANVILYKNPWATYPYCGALDMFSRVEVIQNKLNCTHGISYGSLLKLSDDWPGKLFD